ncbi:BQ5605_C018g08750 [Microbotryum silenes-dioicae]|uniref:BQ5605_C018g08750 protein n=1 Tax=Microbotryum silenes-dioicae TaxID=796604 RepID=A0A2X0LWW6_9BASI|nr:BQ5605_C018g08750 [Microbotryum silenes-dioicae]
MQPGLGLLRTTRSLAALGLNSDTAPKPMTRPMLKQRNASCSARRWTGHFGDLFGRKIQRLVDK